MKLTMLLLLCACFHVTPQGQWKNKGANPWTKSKWSKWARCWFSDGRSTSRSTMSTNTNNQSEALTQNCQTGSTHPATNTCKTTKLVHRIDVNWLNYDTNQTKTDATWSQTDTCWLHVDAKWLKSHVQHFLHIWQQKKNTNKVGMYFHLDFFFYFMPN